VGGWGRKAKYHFLPLVMSVVSMMSVMSVVAGVRRGPVALLPSEKATK
jgi:hypothetical protein